MLWLVCYQYYSLKFGGGGGVPPPFPLWCPPVIGAAFILSILFPDTYGCDSEWQFSRDGLITTAFVLSGTALMVIVQAKLVAVCVLKKKRKDNSEPEVGYSVMYYCVIFCWLCLSDC